MKPKVLIVIGSDSDLPVMEEAGKVLEELCISYTLTVTSAHRSPELTRKLATEAEEKGIEVIIAGAGMAAHLAGVLAPFYCPDASRSTCCNYGNRWSRCTECCDFLGSDPLQERFSSC
jgi:NCAIR mutase (PurE)-related protein